MFGKRAVVGVAAIVLLVAGVGGCGAQSESGSDSAVQDALSTTVEQIRNTQAQSWGVTIPGLTAAAITEQGGSADLAHVVSGSQQPPDQVPMVQADRLHAGSVTKSFTAALILQLDQEGKLSIDDPISKWIRYPNGDNITVAMLLGHTSGVPNFIDNPKRTSSDTPAQLIALARDEKPVFAPGTSWTYSNTNYIMLGVISEKVTDSTWVQLVTDRFFDPLELDDTYVWQGTNEPPTVDGSRLNCGYDDEPDCVREPGFDVMPISDGFDWTVAWAAGAIVSTSPDLAIWMRELVTGDVLDPAHRALLTTPTPQSVAVLSTKPPYGTLSWTGDSLGLLRFEIDGQGTGWGHSGAINGFVSNVVHMTDSNQTVSLISNFENTDSRAALGDLVIATDKASTS
jgi:D-alanyl-D-alanine carboxypeptidase